jgi:hypothetical protein
VSLSWTLGEIRVSGLEIYNYREKSCFSRPDLETFSVAGKRRFIGGAVNLVVYLFAQVLSAKLVQQDLGLY